MPVKIVTAAPSKAGAHRLRCSVLSLEGFIAGAEYYVDTPPYPPGLCILRTRG
jgi:hypothetical protein